MPSGRRKFFLAVFAPFFLANSENLRAAKRAKFDAKNVKNEWEKHGIIIRASACDRSRSSVRVRVGNFYCTKNYSKYVSQNLNKLSLWKSILGLLVEISECNSHTIDLNPNHFIRFLFIVLRLLKVQQGLNKSGRHRRRSLQRTYCHRK